jgi:dissimilatory sulfite reductase (desulfoviridin) alpha/beta subunit
MTGNIKMKWTDEAEAALKKVPFFVRKKVRARVEKEAADENKTCITLAEVKATQNRFLSKMDSDIRGYQIETCFGQNGCPNRCVSGDTLLDRLELLFKEQDLLSFLKQNVKGNLKYHHEFRVGIAECPNACSQPQIRDIAIIGASVPQVTATPCSRCRACVEECKEGSIILEDERPSIDFSSCVRCGACIKVCPTGTLVCDDSGYRIQLGGRDRKSVV